MSTLLTSDRVSTLRQPIATASGRESDAPAEPIHPNSHAPNLKDPYRIATSELTLDGMRQHHIAESVVDSIVNPLPHGEDGNFNGADLDYEEKAMRLVYTYVVTCSAELSTQQKHALSEYLRDSQSKYDMAYLLDKLGLSLQEYKTLVERVKK